MTDENIEENGKYVQLCVMEGASLGVNDYAQFEKFIADSIHGSRVKFAEEVVTKVKCEDGGYRHDLFFYINSDDISKFAIDRFAYGIRWWEDVLGNGHRKDYSKSTLAKYKRTW